MLPIEASVSALLHLFSASALLQLSGIVKLLSLAPVEGFCQVGSQSDNCIFKGP